VKTLNIILTGLVMSLVACTQGTPELGQESTTIDSQRQKRINLDEVSGQALVKLSLSKDKVASGKVTVNLDFFVEDGREAPRMAEVYLKMSDNLKFLSAQAGSAAQEAGKDVIAQARDGQQVRVTIFSSANLNTLPSGQWATLEFEVSGGDASEATLEIVRRDAMLAPPVSGEGLELGVPLVLSL
jgi:hypothetical protein